ncbi:hypothetical protein SAMN05421813_10711 [Daejeonella rubra]|uniref:Uncharacterized protein n=1 Tax=Daejeonella rubra TaxID=990371 RepID=A0A1G9QYP5_9SPHI|nr:hypothetical protein [Daejeonella rubra]SDM15991.1 hypothetical protein SAMN05421813_10711 [Daejeonella rubra]
MKKSRSIFIILFALGFTCKAKEPVNSNPLPKSVTIAINIHDKNNATQNLVNLDFFRLQLLDEIRKFQKASFVLAENDENPELILDLNIEEYKLWPGNKTVSTSMQSRDIRTGQDDKGNPVYETMRANVTTARIRRKADARMKASITNSAGLPYNYQETFETSYSYDNRYIESVQGDQFITKESRGIPEPRESDILFLLTKKELTRKLSLQLRRYYDAKESASK